jgi:hypothetical protein
MNTWRGIMGGDSGLPPRRDNRGRCRPFIRDIGAIRGLAVLLNTTPHQGRATPVTPRSKQKKLPNEPNFPCPKKRLSFFASGGSSARETQFSLPPKRFSFPALWEPTSGGSQLRDAKNRSYHRTSGQSDLT